MSVDQRIQQKVVQLTSNPNVDNKTKLAVRKRFYELKEKEVDIETIGDEFNDSVAVYEAQIDKIMSTIISNAPIVVEAKPVLKEVTEEIITPKKQAGVKVRMQEELEDDNSDVEEVPYELTED